MAWEEGHNNIKPTKDLTKELLAFDDEMDEETAMATLAEFFYHNPAFMFDLMGGVKLMPMQEVIIKGWSKNDYNLGVWTRGGGKSWTVALFIIYWALFNPGNRIVVVSFAFRASRRILEQCEKFVNDQDATLLKNCFTNDPQHKTDEWRWVLPNGATIICLPLGDGTKIRGVRADTLIVDEFAFLPETIIGEILRPFLASNNKIKEQAVQREREDELIAAGEMTEAEREIIEDRKKVIFLSSACYQFEHMYKTYTDWVNLLTDPKKLEELKRDGTSYFISRMGWEGVDPAMLNMKEIKEAQKNLSEAMFAREYGAVFTGDSDGYFRAAKMQACSVKDGETPCLELTGERGAEYVLAVDQSLSGSEGSDHFAMCVMKIVKRESDGRKLGMVVHSYAVAGGNLKDHITYLAFIMKNFNIVYIAVDATQGDEVEFINAANQSKIFQDLRISLSDIQADFKTEYTTELLTQVRRSYNKTIGRIVQKQPFLSGWQKTANEYLQGAFDHRNMLFGGKIGANSTASGRAMNTDISSLSSHEHFVHPETGPMSILEFIDNQDNLLDLTRKECAMIQVKQSSLGTQNWDLPQNLKRSSGANKVRKDSYSALLLCVWAVKIYTESQAVEINTAPVDFPYWSGG